MITIGWPGTRRVWTFELLQAFEDGDDYLADAIEWVAVCAAFSH